MRHIIPISGKDSLATAIIQREIAPSIDYEYVFNPTGAELPEVYDWLDNKAARYLGKPILKLGKDLETIIYDEGILPNPRIRFCTKLSKIYPMESYLGQDEATLYFGIRADEQRQGFKSTRKNTNTHAVYPLQTAGLGLRDVWNLLLALDLLPPQFFWQSMYDMVVVKLGAHAHLLDRLEPWERGNLFAWRTRANCYFCFFQRAYEWIGLLEHYPDLYQHAITIEKEVPQGFVYHSKPEGYQWTWRSKESLEQTAARATEIKERRAKKITKMVLAKFAPVQLSLFDDDTEEDDTPDLLQVVSCGLFCGK